jgi:hypothetical protein
MNGARAACVSIVGLTVFLWGTAGRAAELRVRSADACAAAAEAITEQVEGLLGHPLAQVDGVDFEVDCGAPG